MLFMNSRKFQHCRGSIIVSAKFGSALILETEDRVFPLKECAISIALGIGLITGVPALDWCNYANAATPAVLPELSGLISGPPIQDPRALLSYALPIDNKPIREVQKPLEDITDSLKIAGLKALDSVERNVRQASRALKQGKSLIVSGLAESKKDHGIELLDNLEDGMAEIFLGHWVSAVLKRIWWMVSHTKSLKNTKICLY